MWSIDSPCLNILLYIITIIDCRISCFTAIFTFHKTNRKWKTQAFVLIQQVLLQMGVGMSSLCREEWIAVPAGNTASNMRLNIVSSCSVSNVPFLHQSLSAKTFCSFKWIAFITTYQTNDLRSTFLCKTRDVLAISGKVWHLPNFFVDKIQVPMFDLTENNDVIICLSSNLDLDHDLRRWAQNSACTNLNSFSIYIILFGACQT